jgi:pyruvate kinase
MFRLNFSHGTHEEHSAVVSDIRRWAARWSATSPFCRTCGPKMRLNPFLGDVVDCNLDDEFRGGRGHTAARELTCTWELPNDLKAGEAVLFADGTVAMVVIETVPAARA